MFTKLYFLLTITSLIYCQQLIDCDKYGFCREMINYPEKTVRKLLKNSEDIHSFFGTVMESFITKSGVQIENRFDSDLEFCKYDITHITPKVITDILGKRRIIINDDVFKQKVEYVTCINDGELFNKTEFSAGIFFKCKQKFNTIKLLALDEDEQSLKFVPKDVPSACVPEFIDYSN